ncbi:MAG: glycosyltransferase [Novosphingobium sp.]
MLTPTQISGFRSVLYRTGILSSERAAAVAVVAAAVLASILAGTYLAHGPAWLGGDIGSFGPQHLAAAMAGAFVLVLAFRRPDIGLLMLVGLVATNASEVGVRYYGLPSPLQLILVATAAGLAVELFLAGSKPRRRFVLDPLLLVLGFYGTMMLISSTRALDSELADEKLIDLIKSVLLFLLITNIVTSQQSLRRVIWVLVLSGAFLGTISVFQVLTGSYDLDLGGFGRVKLAQIYGETREPRIAGSVSDPNFYAQILVMLVPLALYRLWEETEQRSRLIAGYALGVIVLAAVFTYSRGGALALGLVLLLAVLHKRVSPRLFLLGIIVLAPLSFAVPASFESRLTTLAQITESSDPGGVTGEDSSFRQRRLLMAVAWEMFSANPVFGVGAGNYTDNYADYSGEVGSTQRSFDKFGMEHFPHSMPLEILAETGLAGMLAFLGIILATFMALRSAYYGFKECGARSAANLTFSIGLGGIAYLTTSIFLHGAYIQYFWLLVAIAAATRQIANAQVAAAKALRRASDPSGGTMARAAPRRSQSAVIAEFPRRPRSDPSIAYVMSRFPLLTETFILREMLELERQGTPLVIFPLLRADPAVRHAEVDRLKAAVHYTRFVSLPIVADNLAFLCRNPVRYLRLLGTVLRGNWGSANLFFGALGIWPKSVHFARLVERQGIAHIHAHYATHPALCAMIASELTGVGFSFTVHAHDIFIHQQMLARKMRKARFVASISEFNKRYILDRAPDVAPDHVRIVHCGIEPEVYDAIAAGRAEGATDRAGAITAVCVASLQPYKGLKHLIRACAAVRDSEPGFRCRIVGEGVQRDELEALISELDLTQTVQLMGGLPQHEVAALLGESDLFVLPSVIAATGQMEGIPVALMEAMAARLPVVSTRISGIPELVEHGTSGLLVEPEDEAALADALVELCRDRALREQMGRHGRERVGQAFGLRGNVTILRREFGKAVAGTIGLDDQLLEWVEEQVRKEGIPHGTISYRNIGGGRDSRVYDLTLRGAYRPDRRMILKLHRPHWAAPGAAAQLGEPHAEREFLALSSLQNFCANGETALAAPRPLGFNRQFAAVLMEKVPGEKLSLSLRWARWRRGGRARLLSGFEASGAWLAALHRVSAAAVAGTAIADRLEREFRSDLARCEDAELGKDLAQAALQRFEAGKDRFIGQRSRQVTAHCDFAPYNILASGDGVTVIDFEGLRAGFIYEDLAYFLCMAEIQPRYHLSESANVALRGAFIAGYDGQDQLEADALDFFLLLATVKIMGNSPVLACGGSLLDRFKRRQRIGFYRRTIRRRVT